MSKNNRGWRGESRRHSLARRGIKTAVKGKPVVNMGWKRTVKPDGLIVYENTKGDKVYIDGDYRGWLVTIPTTPKTFKNFQSKEKAESYASKFMGE